MIVIFLQEVELEEDSVPQDLIAACKHQTTQLYDMMKDNSNFQADDCMCYFVLFDKNKIISVWPVGYKKFYADSNFSCL